jgi:hypothetical protein
MGKQIVGHVATAGIYSRSDATFINAPKTDSIAKVAMKLKRDAHQG